MKNFGKKARYWLSQEWVFFTALFLLIIGYFKNAFQMHFILDDYFFLQISRIHSLKSFLLFFSPFREQSYKPVATELYYFIIQLTHYNLFIGHAIAFVTYFVGLYFLYRILLILTKQKLFAQLAVFIYGISFVHVFQLYYFGTFQEVAVFTFLAISFYTFLKNKFAASLIFFLLALLSKETAILYVPFLLLVRLTLKDHELIKHKVKILIPYIVLAGIFIFIYQLSLRYVTSLDNYKPHTDLKLIFNNAEWYFAWGLGFPNFMPNYYGSLFKNPVHLVSFFNALRTIPEFKIYFPIFIAFLLVLALLLLFYLARKRQRNQVLLMLGSSMISFFIFLGPILTILHRWMVRLMMPLVFISLFEAYLLYKVFQEKKLKFIGIPLLLIYVLWNFYGTKLHESSSLFDLENRTAINAQTFFSKNKKAIERSKYIYFADTANDPMGLWGSQRLKNSFHDQSFLDYYFPDKKLVAIYGYEHKTIPPNSFIVSSPVLLQQ